MPVQSQTVVPNSEDVLGGKIKTVSIDIVGGTADYLAGGYLIRKFGGMKTYLGGTIISENAAAANLSAAFNAVTGKLQVGYPVGGGAASPAALADPAITAGAVAMTSAAANGAADLTPGRGKEVLNATDLTSCKWRLMMIGY